MTEPKKSATCRKAQLAQPLGKSRRRLYRSIALKALLAIAIAIMESHSNYPPIAIASCLVKVAVEIVNDWKMQRWQEEVERERRKN